MQIRSWRGRAIIDGKKAGTLSLDDVSARMQRGEEDYLRQPSETFVLLRTVSIRYDKFLGPVRPEGATITFLRNPPKRFHISDRVKRSSLYRERFPTGYTWVRTRISARDTLTATDTAIDRLDFIRAIWNLFYNYGQWRMTFGGSTRKPVNKIVYGPIHTLHYPDGSSATAIYWWEPSHLQAVTPHDLRRKYDGLKSFEKWLRGRLKKSPMRDQTVNLLLRYVRALDECDLNSSFLTCHLKEVPSWVRSTWGAWPLAGCLPAWS